MGSQRYQFLREPLLRLCVERSPAIVDLDVATLAPAVHLERLAKAGNVALVFVFALPRRQQDRDAFAGTRVLSLRRKRPRGCAYEHH